MKIYKFDKRCLYSAKNRNSVPDSIKGIFSNDGYELMEKIEDGQIEPKDICYLDEINYHMNTINCFCKINPDTKEKTWYKYFYKIESKDNLEYSFPVGYNKVGGFCCATCKHVRYTKDNYFCGKDLKEIATFPFSLCSAYHQNDILIKIGERNL